MSELINDKIMIYFNEFIESDQAIAKYMMCFDCVNRINQLWKYPDSKIYCFCRVHGNILAKIDCQNFITFKDALQSVDILADDKIEEMHKQMMAKYSAAFNKKIEETLMQGFPHKLKETIIEYNHKPTFEYHKQFEALKIFSSLIRDSHNEKHFSSIGSSLEDDDMQSSQIGAMTLAPDSSSSDSSAYVGSLLNRNDGVVVMNPFDPLRFAIDISDDKPIPEPEEIKQDEISGIKIPVKIKRRIIF